MAKVNLWLGVIMVIALMFAYGNYIIGSLSIALTVWVTLWVFRPGGRRVRKR